MKHFLNPIAGLFFCLALTPLIARTQVNPSDHLINAIEVATLSKGRDSGINWFLPRFCYLPNFKTGSVMMTMQEITGSDYYGPVHWMESKDLGKSWTKPQPVPGLGRKPAENGMEEAVSDVNPQFHAPTQSLIAIGEILYYRSGKFFRDQPSRYPVYIIRDKNGNWSERKKLIWDDPRNDAIYACGSSQFVVLPNGDLLIPVSFRSKSKTDCSVTTLLCSFDGRDIKIKEVGTELNNAVNRGLLEPQLIRFGNLFYLSLRAEDGNGYLSTSTDGLHWSVPVAWAWENHEKLSMSTTQQHWMVHDDAIYLVYTRKDSSNINVMRWRAPLYLARLDPASLHLIKQTERVVFPLIGDGINDPKHVPQYGNFHVAPINANESWIASGEVIQANYRGDLLLGRVKWKSSKNFQKYK